jgi:hypothetical protein
MLKKQIMVHKVAAESSAESEYTPP